MTWGLVLTEYLAVIQYNNFSAVLTCSCLNSFQAATRLNSHLDCLMCKELFRRHTVWTVVQTVSCLNSCSNRHAPNSILSIILRPWQIAIQARLSDKLARPGYLIEYPQPEVALLQPLIKRYLAENNWAIHYLHYLKQLWRDYLQITVNTSMQLL